MKGICLKKYRIVWVKNTYNQSFFICRWYFFFLNIFQFRISFHEEERIFYFFLFFLYIYFLIFSQYIFLLLIYSWNIFSILYIYFTLVLNCYIFPKRIYFSILKFVFILYVLRVIHT